MTADEGRPQRLVFGEVPEVYDRVRPTYPSELIGDVLATARPRRALEIGCGTGKATELFVGAGVDVDCIEPSGPMADVLEAKLGVTVHRLSFEEWDGPRHRYDLVYAAQAWHWVANDQRCALAHRALRPDGLLALFWNRATFADDVRARLDEAYAQHAPGIIRQVARVDADDARAAELRGSPLFRDVQVTRYEHVVVYPADDYADLLRTQSDHRLLAESTREHLLAAVVAALGPAVRVTYVTGLYAARAVS